MVAKIRLQDRECPLSSTLGLVGEWWTLLILHDAFDGFTRFDQFKSSLGISSSLLTSRLAQLVENGVLGRAPVPDEPSALRVRADRTGGVVASSGRGARRMGKPAARSRGRAAWSWWMPRPGTEAEPVVVDRLTGRRVDGADFVFTAGPAASKAFRDRCTDSAAGAAAGGWNEGCFTRHSPRRSAVLTKVHGIPRGHVETYGEIEPSAPRVVGRVLHDAGDDVPWHRVVRADGSLPMGAEQRRRLVAEGVPMKGERVDMTAL